MSIIRGFEMNKIKTAGRVNALHKNPFTDI